VWRHVRGFSAIRPLALSQVLIAQQFAPTLRAHSRDHDLGSATTGSIAYPAGTPSGPRFRFCGRYPASFRHRINTLFARVAPLAIERRLGNIHCTLHDS
jgi:hypothetical protein